MEFLKNSNLRIMRKNDMLAVATSFGTFTVDEYGNVKPLPVIDKEDIELLD
jgi:hypothetical protein